MRWASWIRNGKHSLERRWALYHALRKRAEPRRAVRPRLEVLEDRWLLSAYVVTSTADDGSAGTLRDAINQVNLGKYNEIDFNIGPSGSAQTITITSQLPALTASGVFINGLSQGGSGNTTKLITLDGTKATKTIDGLVLQGSKDIVSGLIIQGFGGSGDYVTVLDVIDVAGSNDTIGGTAPGAGNVVSFNDNNTGFYFSLTQYEGPPTVVKIETTATGTLVQGNYIGTDVTGTKAVSNPTGSPYAPIGIYVSGTDTTIGGTSTGARNLISGNWIGVYIHGPWSGNTGPSGVVVQGNYIGTDVTGTKSVANGTGIEDTGTNNSIGGRTSGAGNVVSGNAGDGIQLSCSGDQVQGNYIGIDPTGTRANPNSQDGIDVFGNGNTIGGTSAAARNIISANNDGMLFDFGASGNLVQGNFIGLDSTGNQPLGNGANGIELTNQASSIPTTPDNTIGGSVAGAGNVIANNSQGGVLVGPGTGNTIRSNSIYANGRTGTGPGITLNGGNNGLAAPSLNSATLTGNTLTVTGSFNSPSANNNDVLEFFANPSNDAEGRVFLGSLTVTSTNRAVQSFTFTTTTTVTATYPLITATLTDNSGDTSAFSNGFMAGAPSAPTVTSNPASQTVTAGQDATFTASANGNPTPTVQWRVSSDGGKTFTNISGATSTTLTLTSVTTAMNGYEYEAVFTNNVGSAATSAATLTVNAPVAPTVTSNPSSQTVTAGQNASLTASASGSPTPTVQWQVSSDGGKTFTNITGATSTTLTLNNVQASQNGDEYQAVFSNSGGTATTAAATLTVQYAPTVTANPNNQTVAAGQTAIFTASASGNPTPTVQWQVSADGGKTFTNITGATSTTLTLNNVTTTMSGYDYQAVFTNSIGRVTTSAATLTVTTTPVAPSITSQPSNQTVTAGQSATFMASASGNPTPAVQWQVSADGGKTFTNITGATSTTLTLNNVTTAMSGYEYQAVFTNSAGSATTSAATLTVNATVTPIITSNPSSQTVTAGQSAIFTASAGGSPTPTVQWQVSSDGGKTFTNLSGATDIMLTLNHVTLAMSGNEYQAVFTNSGGVAATSVATLTVNPAPPPPPSPPAPSPPSPPAPPVLNVPPMLAFLDSLLGGIETVNGNGTETITDSFLGIPLIVSAFDSHGDLMSVDLFGLFNITFLFV